MTRLAVLFQIGSLDSGPAQLRLAGGCFRRLRGPDLKQNEAEGNPSNRQSPHLPAGSQELKRHRRIQERKRAGGAGA